jgi:hypothetical protein
VGEALEIVHLRFDGNGNGRNNSAYGADEVRKAACFTFSRNDTWNWTEALEQCGWQICHELKLLQTENVM